MTAWIFVALAMGLAGRGEDRAYDQRGLLSDGDRDRDAHTRAIDG